MQNPPSPYFSIAEIWRYPVKSMQGERLSETLVTGEGIPLDRGWATRDVRANTIRGAKYMPNLLLCSARYLEGTDAGLVPHVEISFPDGTTIVSDDSRIHNRLSELVGRQVLLQPLRPASDTEFYRLNALETGDILSEYRAQFGLLDNEPLPDFGVPPEVMRAAAQFASPPGTFFDALPLNILTRASLRKLHQALPEAELPIRRFRPNLVIDDNLELSELVELGWLGRTLHIGSDLAVAVTMKCPRCIMVSHPLPDAPKDTAITRTLVREFDYSLSVYASITASGPIRERDPLIVA